MKNLAFWMELNTPMKILAFCISSFQSSWYFVFCIPWGTKHSLSKISSIRLELQIYACIIILITIMHPKSQTRVWIQSSVCVTCYCSVVLLDHNKFMPWPSSN
jgi:hypothetical protein